MASIIKRKNRYTVVYYYIDEFGEKRQKWETQGNYQDALKRKAEIENQQFEGIFIPPKAATVRDFLRDFIHLYGEKTWSVTTYDGNVGLIDNYINPLLGDTPIQDVNPLIVEHFYSRLRKTPPVSTYYRKPKNEFVTPNVIYNIHKLLCCAFNKAVTWEIIRKNPFLTIDIQKPNYRRRPIWTIDLIGKALNECEDTKLFIAMNLSFACSFRLGECCGLPWSDTFIEDEDIANDTCRVQVSQELERVSLGALEILDKKDVYKVFPPLKPNATTRLVLKKPKTSSSIRTVYIPKTLAYILRAHRDAQQELKAYLGDDYEDHGLVIAQDNGRPCEGRIVSESFERLRKKAELPAVVFHSLRASSATYKLKMSNGDFKAVQGDTGHADLKILTQTYARILDEDRKINAIKFESEFYKNAHYLRNATPPEPAAPQIDLNMLIEQLQSSPQLASVLAELIAGGSLANPISKPANLLAI